MKPIELLMEEHRVIEKVMDALEAYVGRVESGTDVDHADLGRFAAFIRDFADACHHAKEEGILFEEMIKNGFPRDGGPIAVMLGEHDEGRRLTKIMSEAAVLPKWSDADKQRIARAARDYAALLRPHIQKEDTILYPMAKMHLPAETMERIGREMERFEDEETGKGEHEKFHALAEELMNKYMGSRNVPVCDHI